MLTWYTDKIQTSHTKSCFLCIRINEYYKTCRTNNSVRHESYHDCWGQGNREWKDPTRQQIFRQMTIFSLFTSSLSYTRTRRHYKKESNSRTLTEKNPLAVGYLFILNKKRTKQIIAKIDKCMGARYARARTEIPTLTNQCRRSTTRCSKN